MTTGHYIECGSTKTHDAHTWGSGKARGFCPGYNAPIPDMPRAEPLLPGPARPRRPMLATMATAHNIGDLQAAAFTAQTLVQALAEKARRDEVEIEWIEAEFVPSYDPSMMIDRMGLRAPIKERMKKL